MRTKKIGRKRLLLPKRKSQHISTNMITNIEDFFIEANTIPHIKEEEYQQTIDILVQAAKAFARSTHQCVYIIDYFKQNFLYTSGNLATWCGEDAEYMQKSGYQFYLKHIPQEELEMLAEINNKGFQFYDKLPLEERLKYTISYDFHLINGRISRLVNHHLTPILLTPEGRIWLALCTISMSAHNAPGHILLQREDSSRMYEYSREHHEWIKKDDLLLSLTEHQVLTLSAQGYTMNEIAEMLCRSIDTIKTCKRLLFVKFGVKNIAEAISYATNYRLF